MRNTITNLAAIFLILGCEGDTSKVANKSIDQEWTTLINTEGCLVGSQDDIDELREGTCLRERAWAEFLQSPSQEKIKFLVGRLQSIRDTSIHNCGVGNASEGELAVFVLQHISQKLWTDYAGDDRKLTAMISKYNKSVDTGDFVSDQATIREILKSDSMRDALTTYFKEDQKRKLTDP